MNYGHFAGRLGRNAELKVTQSGQAVCNFALAVDTGWGDRKETLWVDCAVWGERAEKLEPFLVKGKQVTVSGDLGLRVFNKRDGEPGAAITCNVQRITLQGGGEQRQAQTDEQPQPEPDRAAARPAPAARPQRPAPAARPQRPAPAAAPAGGDPFNDDIPFMPHEYRSLA